MRNRIGFAVWLAAVAWAMCACSTLGEEMFTSEETQATPSTVETTVQALPDPPMEYLYNEIMPEYESNLSEMKTTYYCQTYGGKSGDFYATIAVDNLAVLDSVEPWLLAYHIADFDHNGVEDLFVITLDEEGKGEVGNLRVKKRIYCFDEQGEIINICWSPSADASARDMVWMFAFVDDKLLEFRFYNYCSDSTGSGPSTVEYAVSTGIRWHTTDINVEMYNSETDEIESVFSFARFLNPGREATWSSEFEDCATEQEAIEKAQEQLKALGIFCVEMPLSGGWKNLWDDEFYPNERLNGKVFVFETDASISELCYEEEAFEEMYDGKRLLATTTGEMTLWRSEYELYENMTDVPRPGRPGT